MANVRRVSYAPCNAFSGNPCTPVCNVMLTVKFNAKKYLLKNSYTLANSLWWSIARARMVIFINNALCGHHRHRRRHNGSPRRIRCRRHRHKHHNAPVCIFCQSASRLISSVSTSWRTLARIPLSKRTLHLFPSPDATSFSTPPSLLSPPARCFFSR